MYMTKEDFGRMQYDYKEISIVSNARRDASTKFGPGNKVGYFPLLLLVG
jgi:hypothetical protein